MVINVSLKKEFIPVWNDNRTSDKPIKILHKAPTMALHEKLIPKPKITMKIGAEGASGGETEMVVDTSNLVREMVTGIENLEINMDGKTVTITSANELYGEGAPTELAELTAEIGKYFQDILTNRAVNTKN